MQDLQPLQSSHNFSLCPAPTDTPSPLPPIAQLSTSIVQSSDRLFFVAWRQPCSDRREWHLVSINLESSMALNPRCLHDGRFLADFYIRHPHDSHQHPTNQRWWLEYHPASTPARLHHGDYHIIRPDKNASTYARQNHLYPFCQWISFTDPLPYIHGPFNFATINGRQTRDRISNDDWKRLIAAKDKYDDPPPRLQDTRLFGIHFSRDYHSTFANAAVQQRVYNTRFLQPEMYHTRSVDL